MVEIRAPFVVNIDLTNRCNLSCKYCYAANREAEVTDIQTDVCIALIDELFTEHGVFHITIAGGEPLLYSGIFQILNISFGQYWEKMVLLSNGTPLLNNKFFDRFSAVCHTLDSQKKLLEMQISLDSHLPEIHNLQRDRGDLVLTAIQRALHLPIRLQLACVVTKHNIHVADKIIDAFYPRVMNFHYMNIMPSIGRSHGEIYWDLMPNNRQIDDFHRRILEKEKRYNPIRITKIKRDCNVEGGTIQAKGCLAGTTRIDIKPNLDVMACCMSNEKLGNLCEQSFQDIWYSEQAEKIRAASKPYCFTWI